MAIKTLPTTGASNWGDPLLGYLKQTTNNTNSGSFKSFDQWSQRPTNLTADDQGLTLLYTRTGNFHEWTGSKWKVRNLGNQTNILDYGDAGSLTGPDLTKDDTAIFDACNVKVAGRGGDPDGIGSNGDLYLPAGHYRIQTSTLYSGIILGDPNQTFIYALDADKYAFTLNKQATINFKDLVFRGDGGPQGLGVKFSNGVNLDGILYAQYFDNITFENCKIGHLKGSVLFCRYYDCKYINNDIGFKAICTTAGHSGFDYHRNCIFTGNQDYAIYYNQSAGAFFDESNTVLEHCKFSDNPGNTIFAQSMGIGSKGFMIQQCSFINNCTKPGTREIYFINSRGSMTNCSTPSSIQLDGTFCRLKLDGTNIDSIYDKIVVGENCYIDYCSGDSKGLSGDLVDISKIYFNSKNNEFTLVRSNNHRGTITRTSVNQIDEGTLTVVPSVVEVTGGSSSSIVAGDGLINNKALKIDFPANLASWAFKWSEPTTIHKKYLVYSFGIKSLDTTKTLKIGLGFDSLIKKEVTLKNNLWQTYNGICSNVSLDNYIRLVNNTFGAASIMISKFQIVEFDTYTEAHNFFKSDMYALSATSQILSYYDNLPTSGKSAKGDIAYNSNPIVNSPVGWICTTAGTPGTWKSMGNIVSNITTNLPKSSIPTNNSITLIYDIELKNTAIPPISAFTISGGKTITSISVNSRIVTLNLDIAYTLDDGLTVNYTPPSSATAIQDNFGNLALGFSELKIGLTLVDFELLDPAIQKTKVGNIVSYNKQNTAAYERGYFSSYYMASQQKIVGDGSIEFEYFCDPSDRDNNVSLIFAKDPNLEWRGEGGGSNTGRPLIGANKNASVGGKLRLIRTAGVVKSQTKQPNSNLWLDSNDFGIVTGILYPKFRFEVSPEQDKVLTAKNIFGTGIS